MNNPSMQEVVDEGPLPCGLYTLGTAVTHPRLGPLAIPLHPDPLNAMFGRSAFYCHGDNQAHNGTASEGCIIMPNSARVELAKGGTIHVISTPAPIDSVT